MPQIKGFLPSDTSGLCPWSCICFLMVFAVSPEMESTFFANSLHWEEVIHTVTNMLLCVWLDCESKWQHWNEKNLKRRKWVCVGRWGVDLGHVSVKDFCPQGYGSSSSKDRSKGQYLLLKNSEEYHRAEVTSRSSSPHFLAAIARIMQGLYAWEEKCQFTNWAAESVWPSAQQQAMVQAHSSDCLNCSQRTCLRFRNVCDDYFLFFLFK